MSKHFTSIEEVLSDEDFLNWYSGAKTKSSQNWEQWLMENPQYQTLVEESKQYLDAIQLTDKDVPDYQVKAAHERLMQAIDTSSVVIPMNRKRIKWWIPAAAAAVLLAIVGSFFFYSNQQLKINTNFGQVAAYKLPDGSEVMLNANSHISIDKDWKENGDREVWLKGEAFFHVKKTASKTRFVVHADKMDIIVTGTQFNVVNRDGESNVLLTEGSVTLKTKNGQLIKMLPGDFVKVTNELPQKEKAPEEKVLAWTQSKLVFENTNMITAAKLISQHYGVKVTLDKNIEEKKISGILPNDNLDVLLKALEATMDFQISKKNKEVIITNPKP